MYSVLVADDEPMAAQTICSIIKKRSQKFWVKDCVENGLQAYQKLQEQDYDLVISDIRMPGIDGLQLAKLCRKEKPNTAFILISGYAEFEYAQNAIHTAVIDYVLKPVTPTILMAALERAESQLARIHYHVRNRILKKLCSNEEVHPQELQKYFPHERYYTVLCRRNGLPSRMSMGRISEVYSDITEQYITFGRDEREMLYLIPEEFMANSDFSIYRRKIKKILMQEEDYITTVYAGAAVTREQLKDTILKLYQNLDCRSTIGKTQEINIEQSDSGTTLMEEYIQANHDMMLQKLMKNASACDYEGMQKQVIAIMEMLDKNGAVQLIVENIVREIHNILTFYRISRIPINEATYLLEDAFSGAADMKELTQTILELFLKEKETEKNRFRTDSAEFFEEVRNYLSFHMQENVSMQDLCRNFGLSQTSLSKMFRKYTSLSYNQYLTQLRMNRAKELMEKEESYYIKDIAELVGYPDQFYFSRIFRAYYGKSPSEFIKEQEELRK